MSAANTTTAQKFDVDAFILGFRPAQYKVPLYRRADLIPEISELETKLDEMEAAQGDDASRKTYSATAKLSPEQVELDKLTTDYNDLVAEFEASRVDFLFRPFTSGELKQWTARMKDLTDDAETDLPIWAEGLSLTCISHPMTADQWLQLCDSPGVGGHVFGQFGRAWSAALASGGAPDAPFSRRSLPVRSTSRRSAG